MNLHINAMHPARAKYIHLGTYPHEPAQQYPTVLKAASPISAQMMHASFMGHITIQQIFDVQKQTRQHNDEYSKPHAFLQVPLQFVQGWIAMLAMICDMLEAGIAPTASNLLQAGLHEGNDMTSVNRSPSVIHYYLEHSGRSVYIDDRIFQQSSPCDPAM